MSAENRSSGPGSADGRISRVEGPGVPVRGDDIDTDRIIPARFLRCVTFDGLGEHAFEDDRRAAEPAHPFDRPEHQGASILVVNRNFGCGSSREHAPQSLQRWGIRGIVGVSFAEIFHGNCVALGIPCFTLDADEVAALQEAVEASPESSLELDVEAGSVALGTRRWSAAMPAGVRQAFLSGTWDSTRLLLDRPEEVDRVAGSLPYVSGWTAPA